MVKFKDTQFCVKNLKKEKIKEQKNIDLPDFQYFPAHDLNFHGMLGRRDQIITSF